MEPAGVMGIRDWVVGMRDFWIVERHMPRIYHCQYLRIHLRETFSVLKEPNSGGSFWIKTGINSS
ncbi:MAG: hypothetical protein KAV87_42175 [Desulfobacteraceae bacterium]|nr:hypothetical protein [Desulfobacteraceae bacterium]